VFDNVAFGLRLRRLGKAEIAGRVGRVLQLVVNGWPMERGGTRPVWAFLTGPYALFR
jgi:ABC-type taurine transport system ATPase subunit